MQTKLKIAVITQSYYRKDGSSFNILKNMFNMLEKQYYKSQLVHNLKNTQS